MHHGILHDVTTQTMLHTGILCIFTYLITMPSQKESMNSCATGKFCQAPPGKEVTSMHICAKCNTQVLSWVLTGD